MQGSWMAVNRVAENTSHDEHMHQCLNGYGQKPHSPCNKMLRELFCTATKSVPIFFPTLHVDTPLAAAQPNVLGSVGFISQSQAQRTGSERY